MEDIEQQIARSWVNIRKMVMYRGDTASDISGEDIVAISKSDGTFGVPVNERVAVVFHTTNQSPKKTDIFEKAGDAVHIIVVINTRASGNTSRPNIATTKAIEQEAAARSVGVEFWTLGETQYNVSEHELVPVHAKVPAGEVDELLRSLMVKNRNLLPVISAGDPMARYLFLKHGDVVRIDRASPTAGRTTAYRCCRKP